MSVLTGSRLTMVKKFVLAVLILSVSSGLPAYDADFNLGIAGISTMDGYGFYFENTSLSEKYSLYEFTNLLVNSGFTANVEESQTAAGIDVVIGTRFLNKNLVGLTRISYFPGLKYNVDYNMGASTTPLAKLTVAVDIIYAGLGLKYQFFPMDNLVVYILADAGYMSASGTILMKSYNMITSSYDTVEDMSGKQAFSKFGFNAGAGVRYFLTDKIFANGGVGFSGIGKSFITSIGVGYDFDGNPTKSDGNAATEGTGSTNPKAAQYEAYGDKFYNAGNYKKAYAYYAAAAKIEKTAVLYRKLGNCYKSMGMDDKARAFFEYAKKLR